MHRNLCGTKTLLMLNTVNGVILDKSVAHLYKLFLISLILQSFSAQDYCTS